MSISNKEAPREDPGDVGFIKAIWDFFSSMKTAIVLLLGLALGSIVGTVIRQGAPSEMYVQHYGDAGYMLVRILQLDDTYNSWWYVSLLVLVGTNLAVCSVNRFRIVWRNTCNPRVIVSQKQIAGMQRSENMSSARSAADTTNEIETALRALSYQVLRARDSGDEILYGAKGRLSIWGPYLTHVAILVVFLGAIIGGRWGLDGIMVIKEGESTSTCYINKTGAARELDFDVKLRDFTIGHDEHHNPTSYRSDLRVTDGGKTVASKVIDVNHPLTYKGVSFYQSDFGLDRLSFKVTGPGGESRRIEFDVRMKDGPHGRQYTMTGASGDMPFEQISIGGRKLTVFAHNLAPDYVGGERVNATTMPLNPAALVMVNDRLPEYKGLDAWTKLGWIEEGKSARFKEYTISMEKAVDYTVLQVGRNPGLPLVYTGFGLMLFGVFVSFYVTRKVIRVRVSPTEDGSSALIGANSRSEPSVFDADFDRLREVLN